MVKAIRLPMTHNFIFYSNLTFSRTSYLAGSLLIFNQLFPLGPPFLADLQPLPKVYLGNDHRQCSKDIKWWANYRKVRTILASDESDSSK